MTLYRTVLPRAIINTTNCHDVCAARPPLSRREQRRDIFNGFCAISVAQELPELRRRSLQASQRSSHAPALIRPTAPRLRLQRPRLQTWGPPRRRHVGRRGGAAIASATPSAARGDMLALRPALWPAKQTGLWGGGTSCTSSSTLAACAAALSSTAAASSRAPVASSALPRSIAHACSAHPWG